MKKIFILFFFLSGEVLIANAQWTNLLARQETIKGLAVNKEHVCVGTLGGGVFISDNGGGKWISVNSRLPKEPVVMAICIAGQNIIAGIEGYGVFLLRSNSKSWIKITKGFTSNVVNTFEVSGKNIFAGTYDGVFVSEDDGESWKALEKDSRMRDVISLTSKGDHLFAGTKDSGVFLSVKGKMWNEVNVGINDTDIPSMITAGNSIFAGTYSHGVYVSMNEGSNWSPANSGFTPNQAHADSLMNVLKSWPNDGIPRKQIGWSDLGPYTIVHSFAVSGKNIFVATNEGIFLSNDNGAKWTNISGGLKDAASSLVIDNNYLYAGTYSSGLWRMSLSEIIPLKK